MTHHHRHTRGGGSFLDKASHGVKTAGKIVGIAKGSYDVGKTIYDVGRTIAPLVSGAVEAAGAFL